MTTDQRRRLTRIEQRFTYLNLMFNNAVDDLMKMRGKGHDDYKKMFEEDQDSERIQSQASFAHRMDIAVEKAAEVQDKFEEFLSELYEMLM